MSQTTREVPKFYFIFIEPPKEWKNRDIKCLYYYFLCQFIVRTLEYCTGRIISSGASLLSEPDTFASAPRWHTWTWGYSSEITFAHHFGYESFSRRGKKIISLHGITSYFSKLFIASNPISILTMIQAVSILRQHKWLKQEKFRVIIGV